MCILLVWFYSVNKKELFLKFAVRKKQAESLKTFWRNFVFVVFVGCRAEILLKRNSFASIFQGFNKTFLPALCVWNSKKPNNQSLDIFNIIYILLISLYVFNFFLGTISSCCFSLYTSNITPKKSSTKSFTLNKKWSFLLGVYLVNVTKSA